MDFKQQVRYYNEDQLNHMKDRIYELLEKRGVKITHTEVLQLLGKEGANVDFKEGLVRFPRKFMEEQLAKVPKQFKLVGKNGKFPLEFPHPQGLFHTRLSTGAQNWLAPETDDFYRIRLKELEYWAQLADRLEHIDFLPFLVVNDVPSPTADVHALKTMLLNSEKHILIQPYRQETVAYMIKLLVIAAGGESELKTNPLASWITCSLSPFVFKDMDIEIIVQAARHGCAVQTCSLPGAGATGPITTSGCVMMSAAEELVMVAIAQVVRPGTPIVATSIQFSADMQTGRSLQSSVESLRQSALFVQLMTDAYGLATHTYGTGSDSPDIDEQGMIERALRGMLIANSGASVLGGAGQIETACSVSPIALAIDNEMFGMIKETMAEMKFDDDQFNWEELMTIQPGGQFLTSQHTYKHCRDVALPTNFIRSTRDNWETVGAKTLKERVKTYLHEVMTNAGPLDIAEDVKKEMNDIVKKADENLG
jgi:trimethylamine---corrinoid protein Co-methyltransferase